MKKILIIITLFLLALTAFVPTSYAEEIYKITSANFDTSNSMIVLTANDNTGIPILQDLKVVKLENPTRAYFDINNSVLTTSKQDWTFNSGVVKQIKINQFSTNPNVVRVEIGRASCRERVCRSV